MPTAPGVPPEERVDESVSRRRNRAKAAGEPARVRRQSSFQAARAWLTNSARVPAAIASIRVR
jgi:hypothetical protein